MDFKKKYLKYKLKYENLKKSSNHKITLTGGNNYKPIIKNTDDLLKEVKNLLKNTQEKYELISKSIDYNYLNEKWNELMTTNRELYKKFESLKVNELHSIEKDLKNVIELLKHMDTTLKVDTPLWNRFIEEQLLDLPDKINKTLNYYKDIIETLHGQTFFNEVEKEEKKEEELYNEKKIIKELQEEFKNLWKNKINKPTNDDWKNFLIAKKTRYLVEDWKIE